MRVGIEHFRAVGTGPLNLDRSLRLGRDGQLLTGPSLLAQRLSGWANKLLNCFGIAARAQPAPDHIVKQLHQTLTSAMGALGAKKALSESGIREGKPLTSRQVTHVLERADQYRLYTVRKNERALTRTLSTVAHPMVKQGLADAVRGHADYGRSPLPPETLETLRKVATQRAVDTLREREHHRFPGMAAFAQQHGIGQSMVELFQRAVQTGTVAGGNAQFGSHRTLADEVLSAARIKAAGCDRALTPDHVTQARDLLGAGSALLGKAAWNQDGLKQLHTELRGHRDQLEQVIRSISQAAIDNGENSDEGTLTAAVLKDLDAQKGLVDAKIDTVEAMAKADPLSRHAQLASSKQWLSVGKRIVEMAHQTFSDELARAEAVKKQGDSPLTPGIDQLIDRARAARVELASLKGSWNTRCKNLDARILKMDPFTEQIRAPGGKSDTTHPVVADKARILGELRKELIAAGLNEKLVDHCLSKEVLSATQKQVQADLGNWAPVIQRMVFTRDGLTRQYVSKTTPASAIDQRFAAKYVDGMTGSAVADGVGGVRNLKISELLDGQGGRVAHIVGHGVLDMWDIKSPEARRVANAAGARQVLDAAVTGNPGLLARLQQSAQAGASAGQAAAAPPRLTHVSVGLISPDSIRSLPLIRSLNPKYDELTFTRNQFTAFEDAAKAGRVGIEDPARPGNELTVGLDINAITFSFGINKIATSPLLGQISGVWRNVSEHNTRNMIKLIGDLGAAGSGGADMRGAAPGGFIGEVIEAVNEKISAPNSSVGPERRDELDELLGRLRLQTELVRNMFLEREFERADGDSAKMGREIVFLQGLADRVLQQAGVDKIAASTSKGCKSDKDRGGVLDVEVKAKMVLQDLGSDLRYDRPMDGQDRTVYNQMAAQSGQLENQARNAGLPGSKETPHMRNRIGDLQAMQYLAGLGAFASA